jgi:hypothetical protein
VIAAGRPLRFLALVIGAWTTLRTLFIIAPWAAPPGIAPLPALVASAERITLPVPSPRRAVSASAAAPDRSAPAARSPSPSPSPSPATVARAASTATVLWGDAQLDALLRLNLRFARPRMAADVGRGFDGALATPGPATQAAGKPWSASAWLLWRPDGAPGAGTTPGGTLGGSQTGVRIDYRLADQGPRPTLYARASAALSSTPAGEAAVGVAVTPARRLPVSVAVERRVALSRGGRDAFAGYVAGGVYDRPVGLGLVADGYAQAGVVGLRQRDAFVDGRLSLLRPAWGADRPGLRGDIGASLSGGAQPGAARLDIGPALRLSLPVAGQTWRLSSEWRERIAGDARPRSGLAVTLAAGF